MLHTGKYWKGVLGVYSTFLYGNIYSQVVYPITICLSMYTEGYTCVEVCSQKNVVLTDIVTTECHLHRYVHFPGLCLLQLFIVLYALYKV